MCIAAAVFAVFCAAGVTVSIDDESYSFIELAFDEEISAKAAGTINCCSDLMAVRFENSMWYPIGLAVLTAIPALYVYKRTIEKNYLFSLIRTEYKSYSAGVVVSAFISGMFITTAGILAYMAAVYRFFPSFESFGQPFFEAVYGTASERLVSRIKCVVNHAVVGGIIPVFAIVLYRFIHSDFLAASIPMMLMYVSLKIMPNLREWITTEVDESNIPLRVLVNSLPSNLMHFGHALSNLNIQFWVAYIFFAAVLFGLYFAFYHSIKRAT